MSSSNELKPYTYVLVRQDIPVEQQMVQACHASLEAGFAFTAPSVTSSLILLSVPNESALIEAQLGLTRSGIVSEIFYEPDDNMGFTALATEAIFTKKQRSVLSKYPLLCSSQTSCLS